MISLYAHGPAKIEIGRYGMPLDEAQSAFIASCTACNIAPANIKNSPSKVVISLPFNQEALGNLLSDLAHVVDLHGDPPDRYSLVEYVDPPAGTYIKTGSYND